MVLRHRITINVTDPNGRSVMVLKVTEMRLSSRLVKLLFGDFTQVHLLAPGQSVDYVDIHKVKEGGSMYVQNERTCTGTQELKRCGGILTAL